MAQQLSIFGSDAGPLVLSDDERGRLAYYPGVVDASAAGALFSVVLETAPWNSETMWMYDKMVDVPRRVARFLPEAPLPLQLQDAKDRVEALLGERFNSVSLNYYRDGRDSVAWHNDHLRDMIAQPVVALLSLGATRQMLIRSKSTPRQTFAVDLEAGSVLVMAGRSQEFWEHTIPKTQRKSDARISIAFRQRP